jgi:alkylation response protein AidB-like acyl-CoA dehydrogenase
LGPIGDQALVCLGGDPDIGERELGMPTVLTVVVPEHAHAAVDLHAGSVPLLNGEIRSAFAMTEPNVASSDATNISTSIVRDGDDYVINGRKWWITGAMNPNARIFIVMGKSDASAERHRQQSMVLVERLQPPLLLLGGAEHVEHFHVPGVRGRAVHRRGCEMTATGDLGQRGVLDVRQVRAILAGKEEVPQPP